VIGITKACHDSSREGAVTVSTVARASAMRASTAGPTWEGEISAKRGNAEKSRRGLRINGSPSVFMIEAQASGFLWAVGLSSG